MLTSTNIGLEIPGESVRSELFSSFHDNTKTLFALLLLFSHEHKVEFSRGYRTCDIVTH